MSDDASQGWFLFLARVVVHTILGGSPIILWISLDGKPKCLPLTFGYHDVMRTSPINKRVVEEETIKNEEEEE